MSRVLAISPHLDDAIFSAGGTLAGHAQAGDEVMVLTCLTGNVARPDGFALACQLDKGLPPDIDYMALRRAEDEAACAAIDASALHLPFLEAPHRGYESAAALFGDALPGDDLAQSLAPALAAFASRWRPDRVYGPWGVGNHVDHHAVRAAMERVFAEVTWWEDYPYAMRETSAPEAIARRPLTPDAAARKVQATLCYQSQLGFQFGGPVAAKRALETWNHEGFTVPTGRTDERELNATIFPDQVRDDEGRSAPPPSRPAIRSR